MHGVRGGGPRRRRLRAGRDPFPDAHRPSAVRGELNLRPDRQTSERATTFTLAFLGAVLRRYGGALVRTVDERTGSVFSEPLSAVRAALDMASVLVEKNRDRDRKVRVGIHRGPALVATREGHLDYFGTTPRVATRLSQLAASGTVVLSHAVAADPGVSTLLRSQELDATIVPATIPGLPEGYVHRIGRVGTFGVPAED